MGGTVMPCTTVHPGGGAQLCISGFCSTSSQMDPWFKAFGGAIEVSLNHCLKSGTTCFLSPAFSFRFEEGALWGDIFPTARFLPCGGGSDGNSGGGCAGNCGGGVGDDGADDSGDGGDGAASCGHGGSGGGGGGGATDVVVGDASLAVEVDVRCGDAMVTVGVGVRCCGDVEW